VALHPQIEAFLKMAEDSGVPPIYQLSAEEAREQANGLTEIVGAGPAVDSVKDITIPTRDGEIAGRVYAPDGAPATIVWLHGGGWVLCDLDSHDAMCRMLANASGCRVIAADYRLAPEHPFPAALEDCWDVLEAAARKYGDDGPIVLGGDSAGGNMAASLALRARDRGGPALGLLVLVYPVVDTDTTNSSYAEHGQGDKFLGTEEMHWFFDAYVPNAADRESPDAFPAHATDLSGLPPTIFVSAENDPLRDEGLAFVERLREAGVDVTLHRYEDVIHGFFSFVNLFTRGDEAVAHVGGEIRAAVVQQPVG
jgi:acetyl esterase